MSTDTTPAPTPAPAGVGAVSPAFYDPRAQRTVAAAVAQEHRAAAAERTAAAAVTAQTARVEAAARARQLADAAREHRRGVDDARAARRADARRESRARMVAAVRAGGRRWGMSGLWASVIVAPLLLTWTSQAEFAATTLPIPTGLAWLFPLAIESGAWVCAFEIHHRASTSRAAGTLPAYLWTLAATAAGINFLHGLQRSPTAAVALAVLSVLGVVLHQAHHTTGRDNRDAAAGGQRQRWVWHPVLSLRARRVAARTGVPPVVAWAVAHRDRYGVDPTATARDRRLGRAIVRHHARAETRTARRGGMWIVNGHILTTPATAFPPTLGGPPTTAPALPVGGREAAVQHEHHPDPITDPVAESAPGPGLPTAEEIGLTPVGRERLAAARAAITAGELPTTPSAHAIRRRVGGASDTAQTIRNILRTETSR